MKIKKLLALALALVLGMATFTACGETKKEEIKQETTQEVAKEETKEEETTLQVTLSEGEEVKEEAPSLEGLVYQKSMKLDYAESFQVDYFEDSYVLLTAAGKDRYLVIPEGKQAPEGLEKEIMTIQMPFKGVYVANTPTMSLMNAMGALDSIQYSGTEEKEWYIQDMQNAMKEGKLLFAGKYKEPDYELLTGAGCNLVVQSTMVESVPEVMDKFKELGVPVLIDRSGEESHPLGKVEWLKFYGALFSLDAQMVKGLFDAQVEKVASLTQEESTGKTVAIFYISSKGTLYARNTDDYVTKMVELAGGKYIFETLDNSGSNSTKMEMEAFYETAKDADYIIYMYSLGGKPDTLEDLVAKNALLSDFKAVKEGNVWSTCPEFFQITDALGNMVGDIHDMLTGKGESGSLQYLFQLK